MTDAVEELDGEIGPKDMQRFMVVLRGYDRIEVDEALVRISRTVGTLRQELAAAMEQLAARSEGGAGQASADPSPESGFGIRAERLLRLAQLEANDMRGGAARDAAALVEQARADAERLRHEMEQELITRSAALDQEAASRMADVSEGEHRVAEQLAAARRNADTHRAAAQHDTDKLREQTARELADLRRSAEQEIARAREQSIAELDRIRDLGTQTRQELQRLADLLAGELGRSDATAGHPRRPADTSAQAAG